MPEEVFNLRETLEYLGIKKKDFENYYKNSKEIKAFKEGNRWKLRKDLLFLKN